MLNADLKSREIAGAPVYYRPNTSDENVLKEVVDRYCYRRATAHFDVQKGERWLDLGANIGSFAIYAKTRGATTVCYEPDEDCFELLQRNAPWSENHRAAVTACRDNTISFFVSSRSDTFSRGSILQARRNLVPSGEVPNVYAGELVDQKFDGIKMDIEGAEGDILDEFLLPTTKKLVLEYHLSSDKSVPNLERRMKILQEHFKHVAYPPEFDKAFKSGEREYKSFFDRNVWAWS